MIVKRSVRGVVGREVPAYGSLAAVDAFWRISDDSSTSDADALKLLADAGVSTATTYAMTPYPNPNAGSPDTGAVTTTGVLPEPELVTDVPVEPLPSIAGVRVAPSSVRARRDRTTITVTTTLAGGDGSVTVAVVRGTNTSGHALVTVRAQPFVEGLNVIALPLRHVRHGTYTVTATLAGGRPVSARLRVN